MTQGKMVDLEGVNEPGDSPAEDKAEMKAPKKVVKKSAGIPHQMVTAIKNSPKGKIPAGLAKYLAAKKSAKAGK